MEIDMERDNRQPHATQSEIVEAGILLAEAFGARRGAAFLVSRGISDRTIVRVLREPAQRRGGRS
jgi:hypothetical protein